MESGLDGKASHLIVLIGSYKWKMLRRACGVRAPAWLVTPGAGIVDGRIPGSLVAAAHPATLYAGLAVRRGANS